MEVKRKFEYVVRLTEEEAKAIAHAIGPTCHYDRVKIGMGEEGSGVVAGLYSALAAAIGDDE